MRCENQQQQKVIIGTEYTTYSLSCRLGDFSSILRFDAVNIHVSNGDYRLEISLLSSKADWQNGITSNSLEWMFGGDPAQILSQIIQNPLQTQLLTVSFDTIR
jgi:hypothetical protein